MSVMYPVSNEVNYIFRVELCKKLSCHSR